MKKKSLKSVLMKRILFAANITLWIEKVDPGPLILENTKHGKKLNDCHFCLID